MSPADREAYEELVAPVRQLLRGAVAALPPGRPLRRFSEDSNVTYGNEKLRSGPVCLLGAVLLHFGDRSGSVGMAAAHLGLDQRATDDLERGFEGWADPALGNLWVRLGAEFRP